MNATRGDARRFLVRVLWSIRWRVCRQVSLAVVERLAGLAGIVLLGVAVDRLIAGRTLEVAAIAGVIGVLAGVEAVAAAGHTKQAVLACCEVFVPVRRRLMVAAHERGDAFNDRFGTGDLLTRAGLTLSPSISSSPAWASWWVRSRSRSAVWWSGSGWMCGPGSWCSW